MFNNLSRVNRVNLVPMIRRNKSVVNPPKPPVEAKPRGAGISLRGMLEHSGITGLTVRVREGIRPMPPPRRNEVRQTAKKQEQARLEVQEQPRKAEKAEMCEEQKPLPMTEKEQELSEYLEVAQEVKAQIDVEPSLFDMEPSKSGEAAGEATIQEQPQVEELKEPKRRRRHRKGRH